MSYQDGGCTGITVSIVFDDDPSARTRITAADFSEAQGCSASNTYTTVETFDEYGNLIGFALTQEGNTWSFASDVTATAEICGYLKVDICRARAHRRSTPCAVGITRQ
jgi:hypothetical protein